MMNQVINKQLLCLISFFFLLGIIACEEKPSREDLKKEVMDIHDYAMAKIGDLHEMEIQILAAVDSANESQLATAATRINALRKADEDMMAWMRQYKNPSQEEDYEEVKAYFTIQKEMIEKVKADTDSSLLAAKKFLENVK